MHAIYAITHIATRRQYIGSAVNYDRRVRIHRYHLERRTHRNPILQAAWDKYGPEAFAFSVLEEIDVSDQLLVREQHYLDTMRPHFNIAIVAGHPMKGRKQSARFLVLMSELHKGKTIPPEVRARIAATLRGRKLGPLANEVKRKISETLRGHPVSDETRAKISAKTAGYHHTDEAKAKISAYSRKHGIRPSPKPGELSPRARLTWGAVREIRAKYATGKYTLTGLGTEYGVDFSTIGMVVRNKTWKEDPGESHLVLDPTVEPTVPRLRRLRRRN